MATLNYEQTDYYIQTGSTSATPPPVRPVTDAIPASSPFARPLVVNAAGNIAEISDDQSALLHV